MKIKTLKFIQTTFLLFILNTAYSKDVFSNKIIEKAKNSVVTIKVKNSLSADLDSQRSMEWQGTGSLLCKTNGIILTNAHVSGRSLIANYEVIFQDGTRTDAKLVYYDPWLDFAFLKIDSKQIPKKVNSISFSKTNPFINQPAMIIGNNDAKAFSVHTGNVADIYGITGYMPNHYIKLSLNTKGGSSGSPVFDKNGKVIALNFAGDRTFALAIHPEYIRYSMNYVLNKKTPVRKHIGILTTLYSLSDAIKYRFFPKQYLDKYIKKFPSSNANAIVIGNILKGSPAEGKLKNGDIIWEVNNKLIGPNLVEFDMIMNKSNKKNIHIKVIRDGKELEFDIDLYDMEKHKISKMISFNKAIVFKMDDLWSYRTGQKSGTLTVVYEKAPNMFVRLLSVNLNPINKFEDIINIIPALVKEKYFFADIISFSYSQVNFFGGSYTLAPTKMKIDLYYDSLNDPKVYTLNNVTHEWKGKIIA